MLFLMPGKTKNTVSFFTVFIVKVTKTENKRLGMMGNNKNLQPLIFLNRENTKKMNEIRDSAKLDMTERESE